MIAIIGAMQEEVEALLSQMKDVTFVDNEILPHYLATFMQHELVIVKSGIGKVEAAYTITTLLNMFELKLVINIGSAGGLQAGQKVGDVVIGNSFTYHDLIFDYNDSLEGLQRYDFIASTKNVKLMKSSLDELRIRNWIGLIVSGDQFVSEPAQVDYILERFPYAICTEMEAASIAHICNKRKIDFIVIRSLSDITIEYNSTTDFDKYLNLASKSSANACLLFLHKWKN